MLTKQLKELKEGGLVNRKMYPEIPPKVECSLTEFGKTVAPILEALFDLGSEYLGRQCTLFKQSSKSIS